MGVSGVKPRGSRGAVVDVVLGKVRRWVRKVEVVPFEDGMAYTRHLQALAQCERGSAAGPGASLRDDKTIRPMSQGLR